MSSLFFSGAFCGGGWCCISSLGWDACHLCLLGPDELPFEHRVGNHTAHQFATADCVVVSRDHVVDEIRVAVRIDNRHEGKLQLVCFGHRGRFELRVENEHRVGCLGEAANAAQVALELGEFALDHEGFLLRHCLKFARVAHALVFLHLVDALLNCLEVGEHATEPTLVDIGHAGSLGVFANRVLGLALGTNEQNRATVCGEIAHIGVCVLDALEGLLQIDDVDAVAFAVNEPLHLWVPAAGLMPEVHARV